MNYFDKTNETMRPFAEYGDSYVLYNIDTKNRIAGIEIYFDVETETIREAGKLIHTALRTAFEEYNLNKVYVNVIRDNYLMYTILDKYNFITEAIHRNQYFAGTAHDVIYMTVLKCEWQLGGIKYNYKYDTYAIKVKKDAYVDENEAISQLKYR